ncbi:MAG: carbohydrate ABC transporter substrate-binding protein [Clostridiales bacterium]|nr:carbohydrate ABC transporter substrate-binding protein [Clostridiales bacterium]
MKKTVSLLMALLLMLSFGLSHAEVYTTDFDVPATGKNFVIYAWNDEFLGMLRDYYIPAVGGTVADDGTLVLPNGDKIDFVINPNDEGVYQQKLDAALGAGEHIDMFLMEADYALKYVNSDFTMPLEDVGITEEMMQSQYPYTIDVARDENGVIKGTSWQAAPGLFLYRRSLAQKYLGVNTPDEMQEKVKDWDTFLETAREVAKASEGATKLIPANGDVWQVVRTARTQPWVDAEYNLVVDDQVEWYFNFAKTLRDENLTAMANPWSEAWNAGVGNDSIMGYFFSTWGIQWVMTGNAGGSKPGEGTYGDWAAVNGPQPYYWGGTWLNAASTCENLPLAKDIMEYFTIETGSMQDYCLKSKDYVNNQEAIQNIIDAGFSFDFLGGQDHYALFQAVTPLIDTSTMSPYDQNINIAMDTEVNSYAIGEKDYDSAIADFKAAVADLYPEISVD